MKDNILQVEDLSVSLAEGGQILHDVSFDLQPGEIHVLMGPNGAGKSTLGHTLMGNPSYVVDKGRILLDGEDITELTADKRAAKGMFISFQNPLEVPGLTLESFLRASLRTIRQEPLKVFAFRKELQETMALLQMDESYASRDLNVGFSGGEKKKAEILQLLMLRPRLAILDETDSGLDVDAVRTVSEGIRAYQERQEGALLIITHSTRILDALEVDKTHVLVKGRLVASGGPELIDEINRNGFERFCSAQDCADCPAYGKY